MSWPKLSENVKMIDTSKWNGDIDFVELASENPDIKVNICRIAGAWNGHDPKFEHNYEQSLQTGFDVGGYLNTNPYYSVSHMMKWWKKAIGKKKLPLIVVDAETNGWREDGKWVHRSSASKTTKHVQDVIAAVQNEWPDSALWVYSGHWWVGNTNIIHGWEGDLKFWTPHYPYFLQDAVTGDWRQSRNYDELDCYLPIHNNFTPRIPTGVTKENVIAWQISEKGILRGITQPGKLAPNCDLNYLLKTEYDRVFLKTEPQPTEPVDVSGEITFRMNVTDNQLVVAVAGDIPILTE